MEERSIMMGTLVIIYAVVNDLADGQGQNEILQWTDIFERY